jgi:hypothetical protein
MNPILKNQWGQGSVRLGKVVYSSGCESRSSKAGQKCRVRSAFRIVDEVDFNTANRVFGFVV